LLCDHDEMSAGGSTRSPAAGRLTWGAVALRAGVLLPLWLLVVPIAAWFLGLVGRLGEIDAWETTAVVFGPVVLVTSLLLRRTRRRRLWLYVTGVLAVLLVFGLPIWATPGEHRLDRVERRVPGPPGGLLIGRDFAGDSWCSGGCPKNLRFYAVDDAAASVRAVDLWAGTHGWHRATLDEGGRLGGWCRGDYSLDAYQEEGPWAQPLVVLRPTPPDAEVVVIRVGANCW
jgi:hypothetical protein